MSGEWKVVHLGELYEFSSGLSKPRSDFGEGHPFLTFKDVFDNVFVPQTLGDRVRSTDAERQRLSIERGDVFLTRTSETVDELGMSCVALVDVPEATFNGFTKRLRPKQAETVIPEYAGYYFRSSKFRAEMYALSSLSTRASLNNEMLERLTIQLPDRGQQSVIGGILKSLDDKIQLNRQMNETLEAMTRALYKSWFVDFDPVRAKGEGRDSGLPHSLASLFPESLDAAELGEIPAGWIVAPVADLAEIVGGSTPSTKTSEYWGGPHAWATPRDLASLETPILLGTERRISDSGLAQIASGLLPAGTVLLSSRAPIGYVAIAEVPVAINQGFIAMKPRPTISNLFLLHWTRFAHDQILSRANGSTFLEISKSNFRPIPVVVPPDPVMSAFGALARPMYDRMATNVRETIALSSLRDSLLPKLISGEMRLGGGK